MLAALLLAGALISSSEGVKPPDYTERSLCELWAGAQCQQMQGCSENAKERCQAESKRCRAQPRTTVSKERADRVAECAKALLKQKCGEPLPQACTDLNPGW